MKLAGFDLYEYDLPLTSRMTTESRARLSRRGFVLRLTSDSGETGWGEIAPLPGVSREGLVRAAEELRGLKDALSGAELHDWSPAAPAWRALAGPISPSVCCGLELALWNLGAPQESAATVLVNGLLAGAADRVLRSARQMAAAGYRAVKLKVGMRPIKEEIELVAKTRDILGETIDLRLDANRRWRLGEAVAFAQAVSRYDIAYVEEPTADPREFGAFFSESGVPVALDETLIDSGLDHIESLRGIRAFVLKPTLLGGFHAAYGLAIKARSLNIQPVVSACYESGIGILGLARFTSFLSPTHLPAGLDTYQWLKTDLLVPRLSMNNGQLEIRSSLDSAPRVNENLLRRVSGKD